MGNVVELRIDPARLREVCERYGVVRLDVFGSVGRGDARPDSDVDLLCSLAPDKRLGWAIEDLTSDLAALFGRPVDLVSRRALNQRIRNRVLAEAQTLYAA
jgi:predicted nucleotidyltransferase